MNITVYFYTHLNMYNTESSRRVEQKQYNIITKMEFDSI